MWHSVIQNSTVYCNIMKDDGDERLDAFVATTSTGRSYVINHLQRPHATGGHITRFSRY